MTRTTFLACLAPALAFTLFAMPVAADAQGDGRDRGADAIVVNVDEANPPFMFSLNGRAAGVYPELMTAVFADMNVQVVILTKPWRRALAEIDAGKAAVGGIYKNSERLKRYDYSDAMFVERVNIYSRKADPMRYASLADLKGKRVGVIRGWSYGDEFDEARKSGAMQLEDVNADVQNFAKLDAGRLDAVLAIAEAAEPQLRQFPSVQLAATLVENPTYLAFNKSAGRQAFIERFNAALSRLKLNGTMKRLVSDALHRP